MPLTYNIARLQGWHWGTLVLEYLGTCQTGMIIISVLPVPCGLEMSFQPDISMASRPPSDSSYFRSSSHLLSSRLQNATGKLRSVAGRLAGRLAGREAQTGRRAVVTGRGSIRPLPVACCWLAVRVGQQFCSTIPERRVSVSQVKVITYHTHQQIGFRPPTN